MPTQSPLRLTVAHAWQGTTLASSVLSMTGDDIASARRLAVGGLLVFMLWLLAGRLYSFAEQVKRQDREQKQTLELLERNRQRELAIMQQQRESLYPPAPIFTKAGPPKTNKTAHQKMPAAAVVNRLRQINAFGLVANPERRLHCIDSQSDWDYTCLFQRDAVAGAPWLQFGVIVDHAHIIEMSQTSPSSAPLPAPLSAATR